MDREESEITYVLKPAYDRLVERLAGQGERIERQAEHIYNLSKQVDDLQLRLDGVVRALYDYSTNDDANMYMHIARNGLR